MVSGHITQLALLLQTIQPSTKGLILLRVSLPDDAAMLPHVTPAPYRAKKLR
jgi:hypothetical protein